VPRRLDLLSVWGWRELLFPGGTLRWTFPDAPIQRRLWHAINAREQVAVLAMIGDQPAAATLAVVTGMHADGYDLVGQGRLRLESWRVKPDTFKWAVCRPIEDRISRPVGGDEKRVLLDLLGRVRPNTDSRRARPMAELEATDDVGAIVDLVCAELFSTEMARVDLLNSDDIYYRWYHCWQQLSERLARWASLGDLVIPDTSAPASLAGRASRRAAERAAAPDPAGHGFKVDGPEGLPTFARVGGMEDLKRQLRGSVGLLLEHREAAEQMGVTHNGILLHGPPGTGKTMIARATAGEYGIRYLALSGGEVSGALMGETEEKIRDAFATAAASAPCVLFLDEIDSLAGKRGEAGGNEQYHKRVVGQLLRCLEEVRSTPGVVVMAATNDLDSLDPAVVRPGRFDRHVRVDLPDARAREAVLRACLRGVPGADQLAVGALVTDTEGRSAAELATLVDAAKMKALERVAEGVDASPLLTQADLEQAAAERRGKDSPTLPPLTWDDLILPSPTLAALKSLAELIANPRAGSDLGVRPATGALLYGPPGTGKTTIARVIASETKGRVSFLPAKGSDLVSKWVGESARKIRDLFARARAVSPTIVFIDELEALLPARGGNVEERESVVTEFLQQLDGIDSTPGVFVLGATNLPDRIDPAVLRGGRQGRHIEIPLPDQAAREALFRLHSRRLALHPDVDADALAATTDGRSGADIEALCNEAAEAALRRGAAPRAVTQADFLSVLSRT
jgi:SpoVK/Ycf46/Vps4 family AAA+-type ATPase